MILLNSQGYFDGPQVDFVISHFGYQQVGLTWGYNPKRYLNQG